VKVGDLVKYKYGEGRRTEENPYTIEREELGVVIATEWPEENHEVAEVFFFGANYVKRSYKKYLETISNA